MIPETGPVAGRWPLISQRPNNGNEPRYRASYTDLLVVFRTDVKVQKCFMAPAGIIRQFTIPSERAYTLVSARKVDINSYLLGSK